MTSPERLSAAELIDLVLDEGSWSSWDVPPSYGEISEAYAALQVPRVARLTGLGEDEVRALVEDHTDGRTLGVLGEPHVDVLALDTAVLAALG